VIDSQATANQRLISVSEAAAFLGVSPRSLYGWVSQRQIPYRKAGRRVLFLESELLEWTKPHSDGRKFQELTRR